MAHFDDDELLSELGERFPEGIEERGTLQDKPLLLVKREVLLDICRTAKMLGFDYLACLTGVDYPEAGYLEAVYNLYSYGRRRHLILKARCPREDPVLPSVSGVWKAALFLERETYDLVGIRFEGHPDLKRILLPEPWVGHPLRKDYDLDKEQFVSKGAHGEDVVSFDANKGW